MYVVIDRTTIVLLLVLFPDRRVMVIDAISVSWRSLAGFLIAAKTINCRRYQIYSSNELNIGAALQT